MLRLRHGGAALCAALKRPYVAKMSRQADPLATPCRRATLRVIGSAFLAAAAFMVAVPGAASEVEAWAALQSGGIVIFRHAIAPGGGDPPGMRLDDCATQRNLDGAGRAQARRIGEAFLTRGVAVGAVLHSRWCRARETAELAFPGAARAEPAFDSFFSNRAAGPELTGRARGLLAAWKGPGALVIVSHQVNVTALTGIFPASGEGVVLRAEEGGVAVVGRIRP